MPAFSMRFVPRRKLTSLPVKIIILTLCITLLISIPSIVIQYSGSGFNIDDTRVDSIAYTLSYKDMPECTVNPPENVTWPWAISHETINRFSALLEKVSKCVPSSSQKTVMLNFIDRGYIEMLDSYLHHARKAYVEPILFIAMDEITQELLTRKKMHSFLIQELGRSAAGHSGINTKGWRQKGHIKVKVATLVVHLGYSALVADMDITYFKDPFPYLNCKQCDLEIQPDQDVAGSPVNSGFVYYRSTPSMKRFLLELSIFLIQNDWMWDQEEMNNRMMDRVRYQGLKRRVLPFKLFTPGKINQEDTFMYYDPPSELFSHQVLLHHLHQAYEGKIFRMKELGLWVNDENGYYSDPNAKYIIYENPVETLTYMEWNALNNAFKIAALLNRKVILPKFHCQTPRACPAARFNVQKPQNCYCSIIHLLQDVMQRSDYELYKEFEVIHNDKFREHVFLKHNLVPNSVKQSLSPEILIESDIVSLLPQLRSGPVSVFVPNDITKGPTKTELLKWFGGMNNTSVLRFKSLYGNFQLR